MSDSCGFKTNPANGVQQLFHSTNFEIKNLNTVQDILETLKKHCTQFQSFADLKKICFKFSPENHKINEALALFLRELIQAISCMVFNTPISKAKIGDAVFMENVRLLEEKIVNEPRAFQETCRIYENIQNLTENSMALKKAAGKKEVIPMNEKEKTTQKILKSKIRKNKSKTSKKETKIKKNERVIEKIFLRLLPNSTETHQIMMKLENFPRLELKVSPSNFLRNISDYLKQKWLPKCSQFYHLEFYPDKTQWLRNINICVNNIEEPSPLSENYLIEDIFAAYDHPETKVLYVFYEIKENNPKSKNILKKEPTIIKGNEITTPNYFKENSEENYLFAHNLLKNMDLLKNCEELPPAEEIIHSKNIKEISCTNFLNMNDLNAKDLKNSQFFQSRDGKHFENSVFSLNNRKKSSINFSNFSNFKEEKSEPFSKKVFSQNDFVNNPSKNNERKDVRHLNKIKDLVDIVGKNYENMHKK